MGAGLSGISFGVLTAEPLNASEKCAASRKNRNEAASERHFAMPISDRHGRCSGEQLSGSRPWFFRFPLFEEQGGDAHEIVGEDCDADE